MNWGGHVGFQAAYADPSKTNLLLRISGLLDPRMGWGMYSTFHASYPFFRFPSTMCFTQMISP
jgi:hypothetical protein